MLLALSRISVRSFSRTNNGKDVVQDDHYQRKSWLIPDSARLRSTGSTHKPDEP